MAGGVDDVISCLGEQGRLSRAIPGFQSRDAQLKLADAVAKCILDKNTLIAEAGTGTGKTFAYLVPALVSGKKTIISTATKTLQDQLFHKDLPVLIRALGLSVRVQNLKGRANYICRYRLQLHNDDGRFKTPDIASDFIYVMEQLPRLKEGDRSELPQLQDDSHVWPYVTSTTDNCLGSECEYFKDCFLVKARRRALEANVVVINHHLFFADQQLKETGFGELLPGIDVIIFDEAHQLPEIALDFFGTRLSTRIMRDWMSDLIKFWPVVEQEKHPLQIFSDNWEQLLEEFNKLTNSERERRSWTYVLTKLDIFLILERLYQLIQEIIPYFANIDLKTNEELNRLQSRSIELQSLLQKFKEPIDNSIRWVECFKYHIIFHDTPMQIGSIFHELIRPQQAYIFTSATLTVNNKFDSFIAALGIKECKTLNIPSPFDFQKQALLYFPRGMPDTKHADYNKLLLEKVVPLIESLKGRCFILFTSHKALREMAGFLALRLKYPLLIQGQESKSILLARFRELGNAVLLGTSTFWEGVDVKGDALSCVIIDKIPFASPSDPVVSGQLDYYRKLGRSGFDELSLPYAVLNLKQGVGRLIRDMDDKGVLMIADPRLTGRIYGETILKSLPPMPKTRDEQIVLEFIGTL